MSGVLGSWLESERHAAQGELRLVVCRAAMFDRLPWVWRDSYGAAPWLPRVDPSYPPEPPNHGHPWSDAYEAHLGYMRQVKEDQSAYLAVHGNDLYVAIVEQRLSHRLLFRAIRGPYEEAELPALLQGLSWQTLGEVPPGLAAAAPHR